MSATRRRPVIGILGGVGSGKSSVVRSVEGFRLHIVDADRIGHEVLTKPEIQSELRLAFGSQIFADTNTIERSQLAKLVFGESDESTANRTKLNEIVHPAIRKEILAQIDSASMDVDAVILDAALLLEGGWDASCNWLIFVDTPRELRQLRVRQNRAWAVDELNLREASQISVAVKKDRADFIVDNSGSIESAAQQMKHVFESILSVEK